MRVWIRIVSLLAICLSWGYPSLAAEDSAGSTDFRSTVSEEDLAGIRQAALDYLESWYSADAERMESCLHPDLPKRIVVVDPKTGWRRLSLQGAMRLVQNTRKGYGSKVPKEEKQKDIEILDVYGNAASVKAVAHGWVDYLHIAKLNKRWLIVNVLWERKPDPGN